MTAGSTAEIRAWPVTRRITYDLSTQPEKLPVAQDLPTFRLHPNVYQLDLFAREIGTCSCCGQLRDWTYRGPFYAVHKPDYLCPWCIADGSAARRYEGQFNDELCVEGWEPDPSVPSVTMDSLLLAEVCDRTPGYTAWQQPAWLTHCEQPCAFIAYTGYREIEKLREELAGDLQDLPPAYVQALSADDNPTGYLFRCVQCGTHRLHTDGT